jgi:hypothetical protein
MVSMDATKDFSRPHMAGGLSGKTLQRFPTATLSVYTGHLPCLMVPTGLTSAVALDRYVEVIANTGLSGPFVRWRADSADTTQVHLAANGQLKRSQPAHSTHRFPKFFIHTGRMNTLQRCGRRILKTS